MKLKRIFACALASVFTAATIIARPASAADSAKNICENKKIISNEINEELAKSDDTSKEMSSDSSNEEDADKTDNSDTEDSEAETDETDYDDDEIDEEIETPNKQIEELKDKIKVLRRENTALKTKSGILNLFKTCTRKLVSGALALVTSFVFLISTRPGIYILDSALDNLYGNDRADHDRVSHARSGATISVIPALLTLLLA